MHRYSFLSSGIGRGHPFYLEGIVQAMRDLSGERQIETVTDVFSQSRGVSHLAWRLARTAYLAGSQGGVVSRLYSRLRRSSTHHPDSLPVRMLASTLRNWAARQPGSVVVDHPILVAALSSSADIIYQHGELVAPAESLVGGAKLVCVPTAQVAEQFYAVGYDERSVLVTGSCVEPPLFERANDRRAASRQRLETGMPICIGCFSSGAEPKPHLKQLRAIIHNGKMKFRLLLVAMANGKLHQLCRSEQIAQRRLGDPIPPQSSCTLVASRSELEKATAELFPEFDLFAAPSHERSHWPMALGIPIVPLIPPIGSFAPLNLALLRKEELTIACEDILSAVELSEQYELLRLRLAAHASNRPARISGNGFHTIAKALSA